MLTNDVFCAESKMDCIKQLCGHLMSHSFERKIDELHIQADMLNRFTELGRAQTAAMV